MIDVEANFVGMIIGNSDRLAHALAVGATPEKIRDPELRACFSKIVDLDAKGIGIDARELIKAFPNSRDKIVSIVSNAPIAQNFEPYAAEVRDSYAAEMLRVELKSIDAWLGLRKPFEEIQPIVAKLAEAYERADDATDAFAESGPVSMKVAMSNLVDELEKRMSGEVRAIPTGLTKLDEALAGGWHKGRLYVPAARPGRGKTSLAVNSMDAAARAGFKVCFFTVEMSKEQIAQKQISRVGRLKGSRLDRGHLDESECDRLFQAVNSIADLPIWIDDRSCGDIDYIESTCRRMKRRGQIDIVFIDYIQLLKSKRKHQSRQAMLTEISNTLKRLTTELQIPFVVLAQLNREAEKSERPSKHHLKDSGSIEEDGDAIMLIFRDVKDVTYINVDKNRGGAEGVFQVHTDLAISLITDATHG